MMLERQEQGQSTYSFNIDVSSADWVAGADPKQPSGFLYVGVPGDIKFDLKNPETETTSVTVSQGLYPWLIKKVYKDGTTASGLAIFL